MSSVSQNTIISKYEKIYGRIIMTPEEMWDAVIQYQKTHDETIMEKLIGANIRLMVKEIIGITRSPAHVDEYIGSAVAGFIDGVQKLDINKAREANLSTPNVYIFEWVRSYIRFDFNKDRAFLSGINGTTRLVYNKILQLVNSVSMSREEIIQNVSKQLNEPEHIVRCVFDAIESKVSEQAVPLSEIPDATKTCLYNQNRSYLMEVIPIVKELLTEKELYIIMSRLKERTLEDIGKEFNVSKEAIRLQEKKALNKLKKDSRLKEFYDAI